MDLKIDITRALESLQQDEAYIAKIVKVAEQNWQKDTAAVKELMDAVLSFLENKIKDKTYENAYVSAVLCMQWYYLTFSKYEESSPKVLEAYKICERLKKHRNLIRICNVLLVIYMKQGMFQAAIDYGVQGIELARKYEDVSSEVTLTLNIMQLYIERKEYEEALKVAESLNEMHYAKNERQLLFMESALAEIKLNMNKFQEAMLHCERAYASAMEQKDKSALAEILYIRSQIQANCNNSKQSKIDFEKSVTLSVKNEYKELIIRGLISWAQEKMSQGITENVEEKLKEAVALAEEIHMVHLKIQAYSVLEELYNQTGNWKEAYNAVKVKESYMKNEMAYKKENMWRVKLEQSSARSELQSYKKLYQQIQKISEVGKSFTANLEIDDMIDIIYEQVNELVPVDVVGLGMCKKNGGFFYKAYGQQGEIVKEINSSLYERAAALGRMLLHMEEDVMINNDNVVEYFSVGENKEIKKNYIQSALFTKLKVDNTLVGVIGIGNYEKNAYTKNELRSVQILSSYLAVALRNADLFNEVEYLAMYDALTGVYNRGTVLRLGEEQFEKNKKLGKNTAIIMLDIDYFKKINDQYGHVAGDKVLSEIGSILRQSVRNVDFLGRYGGEEFIIILNDVSLESSIRIAERINEKVRRYRLKNEENEEIAITISCGICLCYEEEAFDTGIKKADDALYEAKAQGRNRIVVYGEDTEQER